jgi:hypothetical protein
LQWLNKEVTVEGTRQPRPIGSGSFRSLDPEEWSVGVHEATLTVVNEHWVTFNVHTSATSRAEMSEPLEKILLSWDNQRRRLKVVIKNETRHS